MSQRNIVEPKNFQLLMFVPEADHVKARSKHEKRFEVSLSYWPTLLWENGLSYNIMSLYQKYFVVQSKGTLLKLIAQSLDKYAPLLWLAAATREDVILT